MFLLSYGTESWDGPFFWRLFLDSPTCELGAAVVVVQPNVTEHSRLTMQSLWQTLLLFVTALVVLQSCSVLADPVRVDLFVMSRCPDALVCEQLFAPVINAVGTIVDLHVNYIADYNPSTKQFTCLHGPGECTGNMQQLCAYAHYPSNYTWWRFILCQDKTQKHIPANGASCARFVGMQYSTIDACVKGDEGRNLFIDSINFTKSKGIQHSCTVNINDQLYCIHDGNWQNCKSHDVKQIISYICNLYNGPDKPPACSN
jgi:hypothetical protein